MPCLLCYYNDCYIHIAGFTLRYTPDSNWFSVRRQQPFRNFHHPPPYFFIELSGRKYPGWMFCQVYQCCKFPTSHRNQLTVSVCCSLLQPKPEKIRVLQGWDVTIWSNPGSTAIISIILLSIYSSWSVSDITRNLPILFASLFIDIIFALHYGFIFHLSDTVFTAIVPSA